MGDVIVIHSRHRDTIPVRVSRPGDEGIVVIPTLGVEAREHPAPLVHVTLIAEYAGIALQQAKIMLVQPEGGFIEPSQRGL